MGKYYVPMTALTPGDRVREALSEAEKRVVNVRYMGTRALELLHLMDQIADGLEQLKAAGTDVRAEETRFETVQLQLQSRKRLFVSRVRPALEEERRLVQPGAERWWWYLDVAVAEERRRRLRRALITAGVVLAVLAVLWVVYDRFIAPPPNVRQAFQRSSDGEALVEAGDLEGALAQFQQAAALDPTDADHLVWVGVVYQQLGQPDKAEEAFRAARALLNSDLELLMSRGMKYLRVGNIEAAEADAEQAIAQNPRSGWAYTLRSGVAAAKGDYVTAIDALDTAAELANQAGDTQLEAYARTQRAMLIQLQAAQPLPTATP